MVVSWCVVYIRNIYFVPGEDEPGDGDCVFSQCIARAAASYSIAVFFVLVFVGARWSLNLSLLFGSAIR